MFSKLIFSHENIEIEFHIHELVAIMNEVMKECSPEKCVIIEHNRWSFIYEDIEVAGHFMHCLKDETLDPILFVPPFIGNLDNPLKWLSAVSHLQETFENDFLFGWWFLISDRLISVKNKNVCEFLLFPQKKKNEISHDFIKTINNMTVIILEENNEKLPIIVISKGKIIAEAEILPNTNPLYEEFVKNIRESKKDKNLPEMKFRLEYNNSKMLIQCIINDIKEQNNKIRFDDYLFYVSDHGLLGDIISSTKETLMNMNWLNPKLAQGILQVSNEVLQLEDGSPEDQMMANELADSMANEDIETLKFFHQDKTEEELLELKQRLANDQDFRELQWKLHKQELHFNVTAIKEFIELKFHRRPEFDNKIRDLYPPEIADTIIKKVVLASLAEKTSKGAKTSLFRPISIYGTDENGDKYTTFAKNIQELLAQDKNHTNSTIASAARDVLKNKKIESMKLSFLPNLLAAWFIAELARNPNSLLTGLMTLDMIENQDDLVVKLIENGVNLYDWNNVLTYSDVRKENIDIQNVKDGYGKSLKYYELGGIHPMAHSGSEKQGAKPLQSGVKLNIAQQKEGSLAAHWLFEYFKHFYKEIEVHVKTISDTPLDTDIFYQDRDINLKLKSLNRELKNKEKAVKTLKSQNKNSQTEETQINKLTDDIHRLNTLLSDSNNILEEKAKLKTIIKEAFKQRLSTVKNMLNIKQDKSSPIPSLFFSSSPNLDLEREPSANYCYQSFNSEKDKQPSEKTSADKNSALSYPPPSETLPNIIQKRN